MFKVVQPPPYCDDCEGYKSRIREATNIIGCLFSVCILELVIISFLVGSCFF